MAPRVVTIIGDIDLATASQVETQLFDAVAGNAGDVVANLAGVTFLGSTGISVLIRVHNQLAGEGRRLVIKSPPPAVSRVLELCGLTSFMTIDGEAR